VGPLFTFKKTARGFEISVGAIAAILVVVLVLALTGHLPDLPKAIPWFTR
jgi:hypothetical protein